jgi:sporulation protein YlmC with PRC-barrel domain
MIHPRRVGETAMILILATAASSAAQTRWSYADIDRDGDLELSESEVEAFGQDLFVLWDTNSDGQVGEDEFYVGLFDIWDSDRDGTLTADEYEAGRDAWIVNGNAPGYDTFDAGDNGLTEDAFIEELADSGIYDAWSDGDALSPDGFVAAVYRLYDVNDDRVISRREFRDVGAVGGGIQGTALDAEVVTLHEWSYDDLYDAGVSADAFIDDTEVYGPDGEQIGEVEDLLIDADGTVAAVIAEVGGVWDIGDTHVSIPWSEVEATGDDNRIVVPVTEENIDSYGFDEHMYVTATTAEDRIVAGVDNAYAGERTWRGSELIGDYARFRDADTYSNFGYVSDVVLTDGEVAAVVVQPSFGYPGSYHAYPYHGRGAGYGWNAGSPYYDLPYDRQQMSRVGEFDYTLIE